jgi:MoxR-like ATPase
MKTVANLQTLRAALSGAFVERSEAIDATLTATIAGEHTFILGPPGTAKSALVRAIAQAWGLKYWEVLMTRFSTPEDLFGPVKLSALQKDSFERATDHYLPAADIAFLDECWKANGGILNALLTLLNERTYHNAGVACPVPLVSCIGASNELPEGPELEALYDRFLVRLHVDYIADRGNFLGMLGAGEPRIPSVAVDVRAEQRAAAAVTLGKEVFEAVADTREATQKAGMLVSDRRWRKSLSLVRATAHLDGRATATPDDLGILEDALWRDPAERSAVSRLVQNVVNPNAARAVECLDCAKAARAKLPANVTRSDLAAVAECNQTLLEITTRLGTLGTGKKIDAIRKEVGQIHAETSRLASKAMGISLGAS